MGYFSKNGKGKKTIFRYIQKDYKMHRVMPYGVWTHQIKTISYEKSQKHTLVFMGHLLKNKV